MPVAVIIVRSYPGAIHSRMLRVSESQIRLGRGVAEVHKDELGGPERMVNQHQGTVSFLPGVANHFARAAYPKQRPRLGAQLDR